MDFIKTSSLRALIELTFQRNWNGLIWMSRKGVTTKRVKTVQTALSRISAQTAQTGWPRNVCFTLGQITSVRLKSRPKFKPFGRYASRPGKHARGRPRHNRSRHAAHDHAARAGKKPRGRATCLAYHGRCAVRAGKLRPASGREIIGQSSPSDHSGRPRTVRPRPFRSY
ncbi:unnamed protein product [Microthlaspi erraticum]|uniref:Uncharacterized protein n=1 Tax=Microthlaspi erraticum TaxID=1685480 RepID=A0A6D2HQ91_9BRAS|nr:unnamed protein product [Microthlaspi erraticum]